MEVNGNISLVECPRDAMQGWKRPIATEDKVHYIKALLNVGFDTIDFGSFVSPRAIPQMADTAAVIEALPVDLRGTRLLAIVANERGAAQAVSYEKIHYLGFPFSVSPTFQLRNTNSTLEASLELLEEMQNLCVKNFKTLVVYISMGFGNPYGDVYSEEIVLEWVDKIVNLDINIISVADTVGIATPGQVSSLLNAIIPAYPQVTTGVHLHSTPANWQEKVKASLDAGCSRFDGAIRGIGGCPMAGDELVGNMDTELMAPYFKQLNRLAGIDLDALRECSRIAREIFYSPGA